MTVFLKSLSDFESVCRQADPKDFAAFGPILDKATEVFQITLRDEAEMLEVSPASITRYIQGKNAPHPAMRRVFYKILADRAQVLIRSHEQRERTGVGRNSRPSSRPLAPVAMAAMGRRDG